MKKLILFLTLLFVGFGANFDAVAQYSPSNNLNYIKLLKVPPTGSVEDSVMVFDGSDSFVKMVPKSSVVAGKENVSNKTSTIANYSETLYPNEKAVHDGLNMKLNISDLPTNLTLYPTTAASDVSGYVKMVTDIHASDYNTTAVDISTSAITATGQLVSRRISDAGVLIGQPGVFNITTFGNIKRLSGTGTAAFYFEVYHRDAAGVETLICTSSVSAIVSLSTYTEFTASGIWNDGDFVATDRIVIKTYANRIAGGTDPVYQFQFGGTQPVRTLLPVPFSVVDAGYELKANKQNSLEVDGTGTKYPTVDAVNAALPKTYTTTVYVNTNDPNTATVFDDENPPVTNDDALKTDTANLYIGNDASTWVYNGSTYVTKTIPSTSNFFIRGTTADAGNSKTENIERIGGIKTSQTLDAANINTGGILANSIVSNGEITSKKAGSDTVNLGSSLRLSNNSETENNQFQLNASNGVDLWNYASGVWNKRFTFSSSGNLTANSYNGYTPENIANKSDSYTASSSTTYASTKALVDGLGTNVSKNAAPEAKIGGLTLGNNLRNPNDKWLVFGTSVSAGVEYTVPTATQLNLIIENHGVSGSNSGNLNSQITNVPTWTSVYRLLSVEHGINDSASAIPLATFRSNIEAFVANAKSKGWPSNRILLIASNYCTNSPMITTLESYATEMISIAKEQGVQYYDAYHYTYNNGAGALLSDGVHPSVAGGLVYTRGLIASMQGGMEITNGLTVDNGLVVNGIINAEKTITTLGSLKTGNDPINTPANTVNGDIIVPGNAGIISQSGNVGIISKITPVQTGVDGYFATTYRNFIENASHNFYIAGNTRGNQILALKIRGNGSLEIPFGYETNGDIFQLYDKAIATNGLPWTNKLYLSEASGDTSLYNKYDYGNINFYTSNGVLNASNLAFQILVNRNIRAYADFKIDGDLDISNSKTITSKGLPWTNKFIVSEASGNTGIYNGYDAGSIDFYTSNGVMNASNLAFRVNNNRTLLIPLSPDTSAGTYDFLTRNTSTGVVEKINTSIALTGTPTAPTAAPGTNTTQIATTAFVQASARPYKVYTALLSQTGTNAPVATVLENTLGGTVVWSRSGTGIFLATLTNAFTPGKTLPSFNLNSGLENYSAQITIPNIHTIQVQTSINSNGSDGVINSWSSVEIRVYN